MVIQPGDEQIQGLDLVDSMPEELWTEIHNTVQEEMTKTIPPPPPAKKRNAKSKVVV